MARLALVTAKEITRQKLFYAIALVALVLIGVGVLFGTSALYDPKRFVYDAGQASMYLFGCFTAILFGASMVPKELERGSAYLLLAKPLSRSGFVAGKFFGLLLVGVLLVFGLLIPFALVYGLVYQGTLNAAFFLGALIDVGKLGVLGSLALALGTFSTPTLSAMLTVFVWLIATGLEAAATSARFIEIGWMRAVVPALYRALPNFGIVAADIETVLILGIPCPVWLLSLLYLALWSTVFVLLACIAFEKRNLVR